MGKTVKLTEEQENIIIYNYIKLNKGMKASGKEIGVSDKIVKKVLLKNNIPIKPSGGKSHQKFFVNENFFYTQSNNLGYIIGLLGSDGCVARNENQIYIELQRKDKELLEKVNEIIGNTRPVKDYETGRGYENSKLYFYSQPIKKELSTYNIIPNKTYDENYKFPSKLKKEFYADYIRGLFDGDGCIKDTNGAITWQIDTSSLDIATKTQKILQDIGIEAKISILHKVNIDIYRVYTYNQKNAHKIFNFLYYPNVEIYMNRKYLKFKSLLKS